MATQINSSARFSHWAGVLVGIAIGWTTHASTSFCQFLEADLKSTAPEELARQSIEQGDAHRGAVLFFQPSLACSKCHRVGSTTSTPSIGPDLCGDKTTEDLPKLTNEQLIEALLEPSKSIRKGFETTILRTDDGEVITGILVESSNETYQIQSSNGELITVPRSEAESVTTSAQSLMPAGQMNQLSDRQQFLDLLRYLIEVRDGGPDRAQQLKPADSLLVLKVPEYESQIDHAGFIRDWNADSHARGQAIYQRVCANCHGTRDQVGSLPTALRFAEGKFKNGNDPYAMYRTLTHGFGFMPAQAWMVPSQKYDVIHYIRETFQSTNPNANIGVVTDGYLASLPRGDSRGPEPSQIEVWSAMDYGNYLTHCYEIPGRNLNIAYKGIAIRLDPGPGGVSRGNEWMVFDTDTLRWAAGWTHQGADSQSRFIDWRDIQFNGEHGIHPRIVGTTIFANAIGPGWADPASGSFADDQRVLGRDDRRYGPLPKPWGRFHGTYVHGPKTIVSYSIGETDILESPTRWIEPESGQPILGRILNIAPHRDPLQLRVADLDEPETSQLIPLSAIQQAERPRRPTEGFGATSIRFREVTAGLYGQIDGTDWAHNDGQLRLIIPPNSTPVQLVVWSMATPAGSDAERPIPDVKEQFDVAEFDLSKFVSGGPSRWSQMLESSTARSHESDAFTIETLVSPEPNPWLAQMRFTGLDFFADGSLAVCSWDGDVWHVREQPATGKLSWRRIASGLYQPLGLKVIDDTVYLTCRDQLAVLRDLNADGETDWVQCLNNDHQVTEHFHEFAMGLQVDKGGNFYYAKSGRHALPAVVPQHGTLLRITPDGASTEILATGFRAANGVCLNPDGSFIVTDQEGFWNPKNRINWVTAEAGAEPKFYGNMFGYHNVTDRSDEAMEPPLCWITNAFDRSPAELLWVDSPDWGELRGGLLNFSYGYGKIFLVLHEEVGGVRQGGMIELPIPSFPTGVMRGRFHPQDHQLYACGMFSWAGSATAPGGLYRVTKKQEIATLPIRLEAKEDGLHLTFAQPLARSSITVDRAHIKAWDLKRTKNYGSDHYNEREQKITAVELSEDGTQVRLQVESLGPTWGMEIRYDFQTESRQSVSGVIHNTIHQLGPRQP